MRATREIFWNMGHETAVLMYLLAFAAIAVMVTGFRQRTAIWHKGGLLDRHDHPAQRLSRFVADTMSQRKVARGGEGGLAHAVLFWAFLLLFAGTVLVLLQVDVLTPRFRINLLSGDFYRFYSLSLDLAGLLALLALLLLAARRFIIRPPHLPTSSADARIHLLLAFMLITGFMTEGCRMAVTELHDNPALAAWSPVGYLFALMFDALGEQSIRMLHKGLWWLHLFSGLAFIAVIPYTKLRHLATSSGNSYFEPHEPQGTFPSIDLDDETLDRFGASSVADLSWKDLFDADACTLCGRCEERCPADATGKPLSPMRMLAQIGALAASGSGKGLVKTVSQDALWACTTCGACEEICPVGIEHVVRIVQMRRNLVLMAGELPGEEVRRALDGIEVNGNPFGLSNARRADWSRGLPVVVADGKKELDILYFTGCYAAFDPRNRRVAESFVRLCDAAGVRVAILGSGERCCGEPARKLGNEYLYRMMAESNIEAFRVARARRIVTACPHCFNTLVRDYRELGLDLPVEHHSTFIEELIRTQRLKLTPELFSATYHDSCYLARYRGIVEEPRFVLKAAGGNLLEMARSGSEGFCCGAGGGRILAEEKLGRPISDERMAMAAATGASTLATACPFCLSMFEESHRRLGADASSPKVLDLAEIAAAVLDRK